MSPDRAAAHYAQHDDPAAQTSPAEIRTGLRRFLDEWPVREPLLDVGSGVGSNLAAMSSAGVTVGVEISLSAAARAAALAPLAVADGARLPVRSESIGTAVCTEVLEHVDDPGAVFAEIARVLRRGGLLYATAPNYANVAGLHKWLADRRSGRHDWNPWGAHRGGYEAFMTGRRLWRAAAPYFSLEQVRGLDYGQALTGRFSVADHIAWTRPGQALLRRMLPRMYASRGRLAWHGMHVELVLRRR